MKFANRFEVAAPLAVVWPALLDVPGVVACFPGATLTQRVSDTHFKGLMRVKLGPIHMEFDGDVQLGAVNEATRTIAFTAAWRERKGRGTAKTANTLRASEAGGRSLVEVETDLALAGQVAQAGRGVAVIEALSHELINLFAQNLQDKVRASPAAPPPKAAKPLSAWALVLAAIASFLRGPRRGTRT
jgi:carbon monoxide dehydrogenase subunit G